MDAPTLQAVTQHLWQLPAWGDDKNAKPPAAKSLWRVTLVGAGGHQYRVDFVGDTLKAPEGGWITSQSGQPPLFYGWVTNEESRQVVALLDRELARLEAARREDPQPGAAGPHSPSPRLSPVEGEGEDAPATQGTLSGEDTQNKVHELITAIGDPSPIKRSRAATDLGKIGPPAVEAVPHLVKLLHDKFEYQTIFRSSLPPEPAVAAAEALGRLGGPGEEALVAASRDDDAMVPG